MSKTYLLLFLIGVVVFIITPALANQHHDNEPPNGKGGKKPFPGDKPPHQPPKHHGPGGGKGEEPPHGEKPPHRRLLSLEVEEDTHKPPHNPGHKPPIKKDPPHKPPHVEGFSTGESPKKPFPGYKPPKHHGPGGGKGEEPPHGEKPPHKRLLSLEVEVEINKPPHNTDHKPPIKKDPPHKPPHVESFPISESSKKPFPGDKPSKGKGKEHEHKPPIGH